MHISTTLQHQQTNISTENECKTYTTFSLYPVHEPIWSFIILPSTHNFFNPCNKHIMKVERRDGLSTIYLDTISGFDDAMMWPNMVPLFNNFKPNNYYFLCFSYWVIFTSALFPSPKRYNKNNLTMRTLPWNAKPVLMKIRVFLSVNYSPWATPKLIIIFNYRLTLHLKFETERSRCWPCIAHSVDINAFDTIHQCWRLLRWD